MITVKQIIETIEQKAQVKMPKKGLLAGGAVANTIAYLEGVTKELIINDVDIFTQGEHTPEKYAEMTKQGYDKIPSIVSTSREGIFNYTVRTDAHDVARLVESFDLNCTMAGIDLATKNMFKSEHFESFIKSKEIRVIRYHSPERTLARMVRKATELGVYYDRSQELALRAAFKAEADGTLGKYGQKINFIMLPDFKMTYLNTFDYESYVEFVCKYTKCTKTQKNNIKTFINNRSIGSIKAQFIELLFAEKNMLPPDHLVAACRALFKDGHDRDVQMSLMRYKPETFKFQEWYKMISFCKKTKHQMAWGFLSMSANLLELRTMIAKKLRGGRARWEPMILNSVINSNGYVIQEITKERDLLNEGSEMGHCVGGYASYCLNKSQAIIAVKAPGGKRYTLAFIKGYPSKDKPTLYTLQQFKGKYNNKPDVGHYNEVLKLIRLNSKKVDISAKKVSDTEHFRY